MYDRNWRFNFVEWDAPKILMISIMNKLLVRQIYLYIEIDFRETVVKSNIRVFHAHSLALKHVQMHMLTSNEIDLISNISRIYFIVLT